MLNKNGRKWMGASMASTPGSITYKDINGDSKSIAPQNITTTSRVVIGTGSALETADDYRMESEVPDGVERTTTGYANAKDNFIIQYTANFTNNTGKDVTVKEIGLQCKYNTGASEISILTYRKTIDPVKIPSGGIKTFTVAFL